MNNEMHKRNKKSLFERLKSKRSTKVEPATINTITNDVTSAIPSSGNAEYDFNMNNHPDATASAQSTPTKQNNLHSSYNNNNFQRHRHIRRRSDSDNIQIPHSSPPPSTTTTNTNNKLLNRHSHHFSLCCSLPVDVKENSITPILPIKKNYNTSNKSINTEKCTVPAPVSLKYDPLGMAQLRKEIAKIREVDINQVQPISITKPIITNSKDDNELSNYHNDMLPIQTTISQPTSPSIRPMKSVTIFAHHQQQPLSPPSIAMSACRSRLKEKLLPPPHLINNNNNIQFLSPVDSSTLLSRLHPTNQDQQHSSSPNISHNIHNNNTSIENRLNGQHGAAMMNNFYNGHNKIDDDRTIRDNRKKSYSYDILSGVNRFQSTDSLAKQSLVAANVFNLIPMERARERNFLSGRLAANSLLGSAELDRVLPGREIKIFVGTWNMNGQSPPKQMNDFVLPTSIEHVPDLVCIGTQESCSERFEWEVTLQETLGPTHILLHSTALGTLHLAVFIRRDLIWFCSQPEEDSLSVRPGSAFRTKGAIAISFSLFGTSMLFVTSHLTAHEQKVKERVQDVKRIIHALDLPRNLNLRNKNKDVTQNFDAVYWCGDLNFRLGEPREKILKWIETTQFPLPLHLPHGYMHTDQLKSILENGAAFKDFQEANITFPPTYKFDPGTQQFDTSSKQRAPAYTDRILYKYKTGRRCSTFTSNYNYNNNNYLPQVECLLYDSVPSILTSDHKPVWALFKNALRPGIDSIPLAAGLFNRDVYIEGMKRRLNNINTGSSGVCSIQ